MSNKTAPKPEPVAHGRTPDNTPLPGGGEWAWDEVDGRWIDRLAQQAPEKS